MRITKAALIRILTDRPHKSPNAGLVLRILLKAQTVDGHPDQQRCSSYIASKECIYHTARER